MALIRLLEYGCGWFGLLADSCLRTSLALGGLMP